MLTLDELCDLARLHNEVVDRGVDAVLAMVREAAPRPSRHSGAGPEHKLTLIARALDLEAHHLRAWTPDQQPGFFLQQLRNRGFEHGWSALQAEAEALLSELKWPHLREIGKTEELRATPLLRTLQGHEDTVGGVALTPDGRRAVSASNDKTLRVWDLETGKTLRTLKGHKDQVKGVAVIGDGLRAISASIDKTLIVWDLETGEAIRSLAGHAMGVWSVAVTSDGARAVSACMDGSCAVWDVRTGERVLSLEGHRDPTLGVAVNSAAEIAVSACSDGLLKVWDLKSGTEVRTLSSQTPGLWAVAVSEDGYFAISASSDGSLTLWELPKGQARRAWRGHTEAATSVQWIDGRRAISASLDGTLKLWDLEAGGEEVGAFTGHSAGVTAVAVSADRKQAVSASKDNTLKVWDLGSAPEKTQARHSHRIPWEYESNAELYELSVSNGGRWVIGARVDCSLAVWELPGGERIRSLAGHAGELRGARDVREVRIGDDGRWGVTVAVNGNVTAWDLDVGSVVHTVRCATAAWKVGVSGDGRLAVAWENGELRVWDLTTGAIERKLGGYDPTDVHAVKVSADGRRAMVLVWDKPSKVWDLTTGQAVAQVFTGASLNAISENGMWALAGVPSYNVTSAVEVLDLARGYSSHRMRGGGKMAIRRDGRRVAFADGSLRVMDPASEESALTLEANAPLRCCAFAPNGRTIVAGDARGALHIIEEA
jgi:WD40 repeat protein